MSLGDYPIAVFFDAIFRLRCEDQASERPELEGAPQTFALGDHWPGLFIRCVEDFRFANLPLASLVNENETGS